MVAAATCCGAQWQRPHAGRRAAQTDNGEVVLLGSTPSFVQDASLYLAPALQMGEGQLHRLPRASRRCLDDVRTGDQQALGD